MLASLLEESSKELTSDDVTVVNKIVTSIINSSGLTIAPEVRCATSKVSIGFFFILSNNERTKQTKYKNSSISKQSNKQELNLLFC